MGWDGDGGRNARADVIPVVASTIWCVQVISEADLNAKKLDHKKQRIVKEAAGAEKFVQSLLESHPWIKTEKQFFGRPGTDYDFAARDPKTAGATLKALETEQAALSKRVNKKVRRR